MSWFRALLTLAALGAVTVASTAEAGPRRLATEVYASDQESFGVTSTLIYGPTEAILIDAQMLNRDATAVADMVEARGRRLTAIFITHPDHDHFMGLAILHQRFPQARIYMTATGRAEFLAHRDAVIASQLRRYPGQSPGELPTPEVLGTTRLQVDRMAVEILPDLQADYGPKPANSAVWIPSLRTVVTDDVAFLGVHPWLGGSTPGSRKGWRASIDRLRALRPKVVIPGHKAKPDLPNTAASLDFTDEYLAFFEAQAAKARDADTLVAAVLGQYPDLEQPRFVRYVAGELFPKH